MPVSSRDRAFMQRIGTYKAASHAETDARHSASAIAERLARSWALYMTTRSRVKVADSEDADPSPFYARARARGLYRA